MFAFLIKPRGDFRWDRLIRVTGTAALIGIPVVIMSPRMVPLVWLAVLSIPANSPLSPVFPASFEPLVMEAAKYERAIWVTLVALVAYLYMEYLNWHLYSWVLSRGMLEPLRNKPWVQRTVIQFGRIPFATVVFFAFTPLPFWIVRCIAIFDGYALGRFMVATAVGRFPRFYLYAWLGAVLRVPTVILVSVIFGAGAIVIVSRLAQGKPILAEPAPK